MAKNKFYWRKLDDQAKVFALASSENYSSIFRLSVVLKEAIDKDILQKALNLVLDKYKVFKVKMKKGLFWYYLEANTGEALVSIENEYPFNRVNTKKNNDYLFKVTYFENKINIDFFHVLTDANSGEEFFKDLIYVYLDLKYSKEVNINPLVESIQESENAYRKNYKKYSKKRDVPKKAYQLKGGFLHYGVVGINHFYINLNEIKKYSKSKDATISMYLIAMIIWSIYEGNYKKNKGKKPINICVPINLKKYLETDTKSNFFSYMMVSLDLKRDKNYSFNIILEMVKKEFQKKLKLKNMVETISADVGKTRKPFIRIVPLFIKKIAVRLGSLDVKKNFTMTFSNIGRFDIKEEYREYIEDFMVMLCPDWAERIKCGVCSYEDNLVVTFSSNLKDTKVEEQFRDFLKKNNMAYKIVGNQVNTIVE